MIHRHKLTAKCEIYEESHRIHLHRIPGGLHLSFITRIHACRILTCPILTFVNAVSPKLLILEFVEVRDRASICIDAT
jgi:hypothetical protein